MKTQNIDLAASVACHTTCPRRLISLWDMIEFLGYDFTMRLSQLEWEGKHAAAQPPTAIPSSADRNRLTEMIRGIDRHCVKLRMLNSRDKIAHVLSRLMILESPFQVMESELSGLRYCLLRDLEGRRFAFIPEPKAQYFECRELFGKHAHERFSKEINAEIRAAGSCLAADLNTAAVFHLMRVLEFGLRALAGSLKVKTIKKHVPIAFGTWEEVINAIAQRIDVLLKTTRGNKRQKELDFYNGLLIEMRAVKDYWRNKVMHARDSYDQHQAMSAFTHVKTFMQTLAKRISLK